MSTFKIVRAVLAALVLVAAASGVAVDARAQAQKTLVVVSWGGTWGDAIREVLFEPFEKETGVKVELRTQASMMDMLATLTAKKDRMDADLWITGMAPTLLADQAGLLQSIPRDRLPNTASLTPDLIGDKYVALWQIFYGLVYNTKSVPFEITSWNDIFDPRLANSISVPHGSGYGGKFILLLAWLNGGDEKNIEPAFKAVDRLKGNVAVVSRSDPEAIKLITSSETDIATMMPVGNYLQIRQSGDQYRFVAPKPFVPVNFNNFVLLKGPNNDAAIRFIDFALAPERQTALAEKVLVLPANPKAEVPAALKPFAPAYDAMRSGDEATISKELPSWADRWNKALQR